MPTSASIAQQPSVDAWISIAHDGTVEVRSGKVDIGQRIGTALQRIVADELDVRLDQVVMLPRATGVSPDEGYSSGSNSTQDSGQALRLAAATARQRLLALAAAALGVEEAALETSDGLVRARGTNRSVAYADLIGGRPFGVDIDPSVAVKAPKAYRYVGQQGPAAGMRDLVTGGTPFVHDMQVAGMLHARVVRPPHYHARLAKLAPGLTERLERDGILLVRDGSFLAVAAADEFAAVRAVARVAGAAIWDEPQRINTADLYRKLVENERQSRPVVDGTPQDAPVPPLSAPPSDAVVTLSARFERPYIMHGSQGPSAALAEFADDTLSIWTHSQGIYPLRATLAQVFGMDRDAIRLTHVAGAGCYGHNGADDAALDAALIARAVPGRPILLKWTREDEHAWEPYGSAMVVDLRASLDRNGRVVSWSHDGYSDTHINRPRPGAGNSGPARLLATRHLADPVPAPIAEPNMGRHAGIHRNADPLYDFPDRRIVKHLVRDLPLRTSTLRTLGAHINVYAIETFMDELAAAAGEDPVAFRLAHLKDTRARAVIEAAADRIGWRRSDRPAGVGQGIGFAQYKNEKCYAAVAVELSVDDAAHIRLHRAVIAGDAGQVVDPDGLAAQYEGGFLQAMSWTLYEEVRYAEEGIVSRDWDTYPILRFPDVPEIETVIVEPPGEPFLGAGEGTSGPAAGAIGNALFDATGLRVRRMPLTPDRLRAAALT